MFLINGSGAERLADKNNFLELTKKIGYRIPKQMTIPAGMGAKDLEKRVRAYFAGNGDGFYCKPNGGYGGKGVKVFRDISAAISFLTTVKEEYLLEETVPIYKEFRYIRYADPEGNYWRMGFEKVRPATTGDGHSPLAFLVFRRVRIPLRSKVLVIVKNWRVLFFVPQEGQHLRLAHIGIPQDGCFGRLPSDEEITNLDRFMAGFIFSLERAIGHPLPLLCFDLGTLTPLNEQTIGLEKIRESVVLFECQMPFSPTSYFQLAPGGVALFIEFYKMFLKDMSGDIDRRLERREE